MRGAGTHARSNSAPTLSVPRGAALAGTQHGDLPLPRRWSKAWRRFWLGAPRGPHCPLASRQSCLRAHACRRAPPACALSLVPVCSNGNVRGQSVLAFSSRAHARAALAQCCVRGAWPWRLVLSARRCARLDMYPAPAPCTLHPAPCTWGIGSSERAHPPSTAQASPATCRWNVAMTTMNTESRTHRSQFLRLRESRTSGAIFLNRCDS